MWIKTTDGRLINLDNTVDVSYAGHSITFSLTDNTQICVRYATTEDTQTAYNDLCSLLGITE